MPITEADIDKIAQLAHLEITPEERRALTPQVASIVAYVEQLNELDTSAVEPAIGGVAPQGEGAAATRGERTPPPPGHAAARHQQPHPPPRGLLRAQGNARSVGEKKFL